MERHLTRLPRGPDRESLRVFGPVTTPDLLEAKSLRRDDGSGQTVARQVALRSRIRRLVGLILFYPHQAAALRRPRTEARPRRADNAKKGLTHRGPLQKGGQRRLLAISVLRRCCTACPPSDAPRRATACIVRCVSSAGSCSPFARP